MNPDDFFNRVDERRAASSPALRNLYGLDFPTRRKTLPTPPQTKWTKDKVAFIAANTHIGKEKLADHFGVTRQAIEGVAYRNRISLRPSGYTAGRSM